jgi:hypothetical protein
VAGLKWTKAPGVAHWFLRLRCVPGSGEAIAAALAQRGDTAWVQLLSGDTEVLCALREEGRGRNESLLTRLPRSGRIVEVGAFSRLHIFTGGADALGYLDVLPAERLTSLQFPACAGPAGMPVPVQVTELDNALFAALAVDGRFPQCDLAVAFGPALLPGRNRRRPGQVPRGRARLRHHRAGQPGRLRRLPRRGVAVPVPDREGRRPARGRTAGDLPGHPHGQAGLPGHAARPAGPLRDPAGQARCSWNQARAGRLEASKPST